MTKQLDDILLIGYIHGTLTPDEKGQVELLLRSSEPHRQRVAILRRWQRQIQDELSAEINRPSVPSTLNFAAIAPQLAHRKVRPPMANWLASFAALAALFVLAIALIYSTYKRPPLIEGGVNSTIIVPTGSVVATPIPFETAFPVNGEPTGQSSLPARTPESLVYPNRSFTIPTRTPTPNS